MSAAGIKPSRNFKSSEFILEIDENGEHFWVGDAGEKLTEFLSFKAEDYSPNTKVILYPPLTRTRGDNGET